MLLHGKKVIGKRTARAFFLTEKRQEVREEVLKATPDQERSGLSKIVEKTMSVMWKELDEDDRQPYYELAAQDRVRYLDQMGNRDEEFAKYDAAKEDAEAILAANRQFSALQIYNAHRSLVKAPGHSTHQSELQESEKATYEQFKKAAMQGAEGLLSMWGEESRVKKRGARQSGTQSRLHFQTILNSDASLRSTLSVSTNVGGDLAEALIGLRSVVDAQVARGAQFNGKNFRIFGQKVASIVSDCSHATFHYRKPRLTAERLEYSPFLDVLYENIHKCLLEAMGQQDVITPSAKAFVEMMRSRPHQEVKGRSVHTHTRIKVTEKRGEDEDQEMEKEEAKEGDNDADVDQTGGHRDHRDKPHGVNRHQVPFAPRSACH
jgi:hypothetical protein